MVEINFERSKLPNEAVKLITTFLRFEYALKKRGLCRRDGNAEVDWGRVTKKLGQEFYTSIQTSGNAETIMQRPPKKQISRNHKLGWEKQQPPTNTHELFEAVRRVRNNLLHGGKAGHPDAQGEPNRNEKLIREAQFIIEEALYRMGNVREHFEGHR